MSYEEDLDEIEDHILHPKRDGFPNTELRVLMFARRLIKICDIGGIDCSDLIERAWTASAKDQPKPSGHIDRLVGPTMDAIAEGIRKGMKDADG